MSKVILKNLHKAFDTTVAVQKVDLEIREGEFFSLLGPSGCGKTTTLRMIAGFELPTSGKIFFDEQEVTRLKPNLRNTGMVFQNFALFPHMTVFQNVAFGLQARKVAKPEISHRVQKALGLVGLEELAARSVTQLSGGQQQRVALARAIVIEPGILLLDEPLSNLDAKLREETRDEIKALQHRLGITTIYVTHDQDEALSLSDRIAVLNNGVCQQIGTPAEIYEKPANTFVARFVGNSNIVKGTMLVEAGQKIVAVALEWRLRVENSEFVNKQKVALGLRAEHIQIVDGSTDAVNVFTGTLKRLSYSGSVVDYEVDVFGFRLRLRRLAKAGDFKRQVGTSLQLTIHPSQITVLPQ